MSRLAESPKNIIEVNALGVNASRMNVLGTNTRGDALGTNTRGDALGTNTRGDALGTNTPGGTNPVIAGREVKAGDDYLAKVAKYIPGEIVAAYLAAQTLITNLAATATGETVAFLTMVVILAVLNPFYLMQLAKKESEATQDRKAWKRQAIVSTLSFLVWVYALVEAPSALGIYNALFASLLLIVWTLLAGLVVPEDA